MGKNIHKVITYPLPPEIPHNSESYGFWTICEYA